MKFRIVAAVINGSCTVIELTKTQNSKFLPKRGNCIQKPYSYDYFPENILESSE